VAANLPSRLAELAYTRLVLRAIAKSPTPRASKVENRQRLSGLYVGATASSGMAMNNDIRRKVVARTQVNELPVSPSQLSKANGALETHLWRPAANQGALVSRIYFRAAEMRAYRTIAAAAEERGRGAGAYVEGLNTRCVPVRRDTQGSSSSR
jgi:hypothetical protein